jgi:hypothetical protein
MACFGLILTIFREASKLRDLEPLAFDPTKVVELLKPERQQMAAAQPGRAR